MSSTRDEAARERDRLSNPTGPMLFGAGVLVAFLALMSGWRASRC